MALSRLSRGFGMKSTIKERRRKGGVVSVCVCVRGAVGSRSGINRCLAEDVTAKSPREVVGRPRKKTRKFRRAG